MKTIILLLTLLVTNVFAETEISKATIKKWLASENENIEIERIVPIWLSNGEKGFIAALNIADTCRNCWASYALVRPKYQQARKLEDKQLGGQYNDIRIISDGHKTKSSLIELGSGGSGQGYVSESLTWLSFDGWKLVTHYTLESSYDDNSGTCGEELGRCKSTRVFLNLVETNPLKIAKTTVISEGDTLNSMTSTVTAEIITP